MPLALFFAPSLRQAGRLPHLFVCTVSLRRYGGRGASEQTLHAAAVASEYRLQPEVNKGLEAREALFPLEKGFMGTGLKPLNHFRLKAVLRPGRLVGILTYSLALLASWRFITCVRLAGHTA